MKLGIFTPWSCCDGKEMYKKTWCTCKVVVLLILTRLFWRSRCRRRRRRRILRSLIRTQTRLRSDKVSNRTDFYIVIQQLISTVPKRLELSPKLSSRVLNTDGNSNTHDIFFFLNKSSIALASSLDLYACNRMCLYLNEFALKWRYLTRQAS